MKRVLMVLAIAFMAMGLLASCATKSGTCSGPYVQVPPAVPVVTKAAPVVKPAPAPIVIYFDFDKSNIKVSEQSKVDQAVKALKDDPKAIAKIEGHTDPIGTGEYNMPLGMARANSVKAALVAKGVDAKRISVVSYGETKLVKPGIKSKADNAPNRRAVVVIKIQ